MEKIISIKERINKSTVNLIVTKDLNVGIETDSLTYISTGITPYQLGGFVLSNLANVSQYGARLEDKNALLVNGKDKEQAFISITKGSGFADRNKNKFSIYHTPAVISCNSLNGEKDIVYRLTGVQAMDYVSQVKNLIAIPELNIIAGLLKVYKENDKIFVKVKNSESVPVDGEDRDILLRVLEQWLSGQYLFDLKRFEKEKEQAQKANNKQTDSNNNDNNNRFYYRTRYNRKNLLFTGSPNPKIKINEHYITLSYSHVAELFFILYYI